MTNSRFVGRLLRSTVLSGAMFAAASPVLAQDVEEIDDATEEVSEERETIVVTGSRLRRDAFSSPSPLTALDADAGRTLGVTSIQELVQRSVVVGGQQIDQTLNTNAGNSNATEAPPTGGTGSSNINLRGLGAARTLVLLNGRRLMASGVRGAPEQPDIGLIPFSAVERVDIVTEAGSSIYGADAVAGTVNVILRDDFEGFEITGQIDRPFAAGGNTAQIGFIAGAVGDRARITFSGEYFDRERVSAFQRDFAALNSDIEVDADGNVFDAPINGFFDANLFDPNFDVICFTPGMTGAGQPTDFTNCGDLGPPAGFEDLGDSNFIYFPEYSDLQERSLADLVGPLERISLLTSGEVDLDWFGTANQFYFEGFYFSRRNFSIGAIEQQFPTIPGSIPQLDMAGNIIVDGTGAPILVDNPLNPFDGDVVPVITLEDVPQTFDVELQQIRFVGGMRGEFPTGWLADNNWTWDVYFSYDRGTGFVAQPILFENAVINSLDYVQDANGDIICRPRNIPDAFGFTTPEACVVWDALDPVNFFGGEFGEGVFPNDDVRNFLTGDRTNRTAIEQYVVNGFVQGDLFQSPWGGTVTAGVGFEYREDIIDSRNSLIGVRGLNVAENPVPEGNTRGARNFTEFFGEVAIPLVTDRPFMELLSIDGAVRYTDESNFGSDVTYRVRGQWKPVDWITISGGYGTSFRAPNLRESFLADQGGGVSGALDPCTNVNIQTAITLAGGGDMDPDVQFLIDNCIASGVGFTDADMNGFLDTTVLGTTGVTTIPTTSGGNADLEPETSETFTLTGSFSQPWYDGFDFDVAVSYYDINITNSVAEPLAEVIIGNCYNDQEFPQQTSPFCSLISRATTGSPESQLLNNIDLTFFNIGEDTARGIDITNRIGFDVGTVGGEVLSFGVVTAAAIQLERIIQLFDPTDRDDNLRELGFPKLRLNVSPTFTWGRFTLQSEHRYIGAQQQDDTEAFRDNPFFVGVQLTADKDFVESLWYHDVALSYDLDEYSFSVGVNNIADREPPFIDDSEGPNRNTAVSSSGYDFFGRSYFVTFRAAF